MTLVVALGCVIALAFWLRGELQKAQFQHADRMERALGANRQELQAGLAQATQALQTRIHSLETQVEGKLQQNLQEGFKHFSKVQEHLAAAELKLAGLGAVGQSISDLNQLLKLPHLRGGFGEAALERLLADFLPAQAFELQYAVVPGSAERVDAVVRFARQVLPIDSKFPREQVLPLFDGEGDLVQARAALAETIKAQARSIAAKYIRPEHGTTDMALMFLPSETLYFEVARDAALFEHLARLKVFPVSPNTLCISLHSVSMAREYYEMARGVERTVEDVRKARRHFQHFEKRFEDVGRGIRKAQEAFETAHTHLGRYESSVLRLTGETPEDPGEPPEGRGARSSAPDPASVTRDRQEVQDGLLVEIEIGSGPRQA